MSTARTLTRVVALFAAATLVAACGGGSDSPREPGASPAPSPAPVPVPAPAPAPAPSPAEDFTLTLSTDKQLVIQGATATVTATVQRAAGFDGPVTVTLSGLPDGVTAAQAIVAGGATSVPIVLSAAAAAPHSLPTGATATGTSGTKTATKPLTVTVGGAPGSMDTSFNGGAQLTSVAEGEDYAIALAVQADGKVITVGRTTTTAGGADIAITRHLRDGTLDTAFGDGGRVVTAVADERGSDEAAAVAVQADGKIVVGGYTTGAGNNRDFLLVRYLPDGTLDAAFGTGGKVVTAIGDDTDQVHALALQADGKIVAGGTAAFTGTTGLDFALARYTAAGTLDADFGTGGKVTTSFAGNATERVYALALQPVGNETRIVAVGGEGRFIAARYTAAGQLDGTFGNGGRVHTLFTSVIGAANAVATAADGKLVVAGHIGNDLAMVQLDMNGALDAGFGTGGKVVAPLSAGNWDQATSIVRQAGGKLLLGGWVYDGVTSNGDFALLRYGADGTPDPTFGTAGKTIVSLAANARSDSGRAIALQADDRVPTVRVLQAGEASDSGYKFGLLRYWL
jgi:uncharacterized delta-60 repeat protein